MASKILKNIQLMPELAASAILVSSGMPKSWSEKFTHPSEAVVKPLDKPYAGQEPGVKMLIPTPAVIAAYVESIPEGESRSMPRLREDLAVAHKADFTCPLTAGIFLRIAAERAWEMHEAGKPLKAITPFWRAVDLKSPMAKKLACGLDFLSKQRKREKLDGAGEKALKPRRPR